MELILGRGSVEPNTPLQHVCQALTC